MKQLIITFALSSLLFFFACDDDADTITVTETDTVTVTETDTVTVIEGIEVTISSNITTDVTLSLIHI